MTDVSILTGHKWMVTSDLTTYSDSGAVTHNNLPAVTSCLDTTYLEFHDYAQNSTVRYLYEYFSNHCSNANYNNPNITIGSWNIDNDNANLLINYNGTDPLNGTWFSIKSISGSSFILTTVSNQISSYSNTIPPTAIYHQVTETITFSALN